MLVLSRRERESIKIGDEITITVKRIHGNRISLSIEAPKSIPVVRGELERNGHNRAA